MIIIEITNVEDLVRAQLGPLGSWLLHTLELDEGLVEKEILKQIHATFVKNGVKANLFSISGPDMLSNGHLELPLDFQSKELRLNNCHLEVPVKVRSAEFIS
jgi:hypothetical protein